MVPIPANVVFITGAASGMAALFLLFRAARDQDERIMWARVMAIYTVIVIVLWGIGLHDGFR